MPTSLHLAATSWAANMAAYGDDSSRSALTFIPPVTREMVSLPERSVTWTKVSLNLGVSGWDLRAKGSHARSEDVSNAKDVLTLGDLGAEGNSLLLGGSDFLGGLRVSSSTA